MIIIDVVFYKRYIMRNAISYRKSRKYTQKILRSVKNINLITIKNQLDIIYNNINLKLRRNIKKSNYETTINAFFTSFDKYKYE